MPCAYDFEGVEGVSPGALGLSDEVGSGIARTYLLASANDSSIYTRETRRKSAVNEKNIVMAPHMNNGKEKKIRRGDTTKREKAVVRGVLKVEGSMTGKIGTYLLRKRRVYNQPLLVKKTTAIEEDKPRSNVRSWTVAEDIKKKSRKT